MNTSHLSRSEAWATVRYALHVEGATEASLEQVDALVADRERYRSALERIAYPPSFVQSRSTLSGIAREALDAES